MNKKLKLAELASTLGLDFCGDGDHLIEGIAPLNIAQAQHISFLASASHQKSLQGSSAGVVVLTQEMSENYPGNSIISKNPYLTYAKLSKIFDPRPERTAGVHPSAVVSDSAQIAPTASIGANCVIGDNVVIGQRSEVYPGVVISENSRLGDDCLIYANVSIYSNVRIGSNVIIHSATVIGSDGFGFAPTPEGWVKIHQIGGVVIGDKVDIGSGTTIDRGALQDTVIHDGVIIDNQVHIAHNVEVGENTAIAGCVGIAGSVKIGKNCTFGGACAIAGHIEIADNCHFKGGTIVTKGTKSAGEFASITPMLDAKKWSRTAVRYSQLDDLVNRVKTLEKAHKK